MKFENLILESKKKEVRERLDALLETCEIASKCLTEKMDESGAAKEDIRCERAADNIAYQKERLIAADELYLTCDDEVTNKAQRDCGDEVLEMLEDSEAEIKMSMENMEKFCRTRRYLRMIKKVISKTFHLSIRSVGWVASKLLRAF